MQSVGDKAAGSRSASTVRPMHVQTPLIESRVLGKIAGCKVYLKLENTQPSGSFKLRGISNVVRKVRTISDVQICQATGCIIYIYLYFAK